MWGKLRIRVFSRASFDYFSHTPTRGTSIQLHLGIGVEGIISLSIWLLLSKGAR
jgi:hypothetical protein